MKAEFRVFGHGEVVRWTRNMCIRFLIARALDRIDIWVLEWSVVVEVYFRVSRVGQGIRGRYGTWYFIKLLCCLERLEILLKEVRETPYMFDLRDAHCWLAAVCFY